MFRLNRIGRSIIGLTAAGLLSGCLGDDDEVLGPRLTGDEAIFQNYVAIGNSVTAGFQAGGISNTTQRQSYAFLLARQMETRFAYPSLNEPGCPPPITNFQTQTRSPAGATSTTCALRGAVTDILNNVAVPGASSFDPTAASTPFSNTLTSFILGGKTQVERALDARPTFASIWIGNNDVLGFAVGDARAAAATGLAGMTSTTQFQANYDAMIDALLAGAPNLEGILIGVVQVANAPIMFPAAALSNPVFKAGFDAIANTTTTLDPSCLPGGAGFSSLINTFLAFQIRLGAHPTTIACVAGGTSGLIPPPVGDILVLDPVEQTTVQTRVSDYNASIAAKATSLGWAYYDPNPTLTTFRTAGTVVTNVPTLQPTGTFGTGMSIDGVHPGPALHRIIANELIPLINAHYNTDVALVP